MGSQQSLVLCDSEIQLDVVRIHYCGGRGCSLIGAQLCCLGMVLCGSWWHQSALWVIFLLYKNCPSARCQFQQLRNVLNLIRNILKYFFYFPNYHGQYLTNCPLPKYIAYVDLSISPITISLLLFHPPLLATLLVFTTVHYQSKCHTFTAFYHSGTPFFYTNYLLTTWKYGLG